MTVFSSQYIVMWWDMSWEIRGESFHSGNSRVYLHKLDGMSYYTSRLYYNLMEPPSYMWAIIEWNSIMWHITEFASKGCYQYLNYFVHMVGKNNGITLLFLIVFLKNTAKLEMFSDLCWLFVILRITDIWYLIIFLWGIFFLLICGY
jgi:hypothetical protein